MSLIRSKRYRPAIYSLIRLNFQLWNYKQVFSPLHKVEKRHQGRRNTKPELWGCILTLWKCLMFKRQAHIFRFDMFTVLYALKIRILMVFCLFLIEMRTVRKQLKQWIPKYFLMHVSTNSLLIDTEPPRFKLADIRMKPDEGIMVYWGGQGGGLTL